MEKDKEQLKLDHRAKRMNSPDSDEKLIIKIKAD
jgi:hypothetical protein